MIADSPAGSPSAAVPADPVAVRGERPKELGQSTRKGAGETLLYIYDTCNDPMRCCCYGCSMDTRGNATTNAPMYGGSTRIIIPTVVRRRWVASSVQQCCYYVPCILHPFHISSGGPCCTCAAVHTRAIVVPVGTSQRKIPAPYSSTKYSVQQI